MYETEISCVNIVKDVQRDGIKLCAIFIEKTFNWDGWKLQGIGGGVS